ncbi:hypothetical protein H9P43_005002 [Blastocladiella emersonii ATCC 22665]|nr:hypothetical protein H9P43_005002 [Blastocladiella emersonii ATCC 22665]
MADPGVSADTGSGSGSGTPHPLPPLPFPLADRTSSDLIREDSLLHQFISSAADLHDDGSASAASPSASASAYGNDALLLLPPLAAPTPPPPLPDPSSGGTPDPHASLHSSPAAAGTYYRGYYHHYPAADASSTGSSPLRRPLGSPPAQSPVLPTSLPFDQLLSQTAATDTDADQPRSLGPRTLSLLSPIQRIASAFGNDLFAPATGSIPATTSPRSPRRHVVDLELHGDFPDSGDEGGDQFPDHARGAHLHHHHRPSLPLESFPFESDLASVEPLRDTEELGGAAPPPSPPAADPTHRAAPNRSLLHHHRHALPLEHPAPAPAAAAPLLPQLAPGSARVAPPLDVSAAHFPTSVNGNSFVANVGQDEWNLSAEFRHLRDELAAAHLTTAAASSTSIIMAGPPPPPPPSSAPAPNLQPIMGMYGHQQQPQQQLSFPAGPSLSSLPLPQPHSAPATTVSFASPPPPPPQQQQQQTSALGFVTTLDSHSGAASTSRLSSMPPQLAEIPDWAQITAAAAAGNAALQQPQALPPLPPLPPQSAAAPSPAQSKKTKKLAPKSKPKPKPASPPARAGNARPGRKPSSSGAGDLDEQHRSDDDFGDGGDLDDTASTLRLMQSARAANAAAAAAMSMSMSAGLPKEDDDDGAGAGGAGAGTGRKKKKKKNIFCAEHRDYLLNYFATVTRTPDRVQRDDIVKVVGTNEKTIRIWFQNQRQKIVRLARRSQLQADRAAAEQAVAAGGGSGGLVPAAAVHHLQDPDFLNHPFAPTPVMGSPAAAASAATQNAYGSGPLGSNIVLRPVADMRQQPAQQQQHHEVMVPPRPPPPPATSTAQSIPAPVPSPGFMVHHHQQHHASPASQQQQQQQQFVPPQQPQHQQFLPPHSAPHHHQHQHHAHPAGGVIGSSAIMNRGHVLSPVTPTFMPPHSSSSGQHPHPHPHPHPHHYHPYHHSAHTNNGTFRRPSSQQHTSAPTSTSTSPFQPAQLRPDHAAEPNPFEVAFTGPSPPVPAGIAYHYGSVAQTPTSMQFPASRSATGTPGPAVGVHYPSPEIKRYPPIAPAPPRQPQQQPPQQHTQAVFVLPQPPHAGEDLFAALPLPPMSSLAHYDGGNGGNGFAPPPPPPPGGHPQVGGNGGFAPLQPQVTSALGLYDPTKMGAPTGPAVAGPFQSAPIPQHHHQSLVAALPLEVPAFQGHGGVPGSASVTSSMYAFGSPHGGNGTGTATATGSMAGTTTSYHAGTTTSSYE